MKRGILLCVGAAWALLEITSFAGPIRPEQIPAAAKWLVHIDVAAFNASSIGATFFKDLEADPAGAAKLDMLRATFGFDLRKDLSAVTLYGLDADKRHAVALCAGVFQVETILAHIKANPDYEEIAYAGLAIYKWANGQRIGYGCFYSDSLLVLSRDVERVKEAIGVLHGTTPHLASGSALIPAGASAAGVFLVGSAQGLSSDPALQPRAVILRSSERIAAVAGESNGNFSGSLLLDAPSAEQAAQMAEIFRGMLAFSALQEAGNQTAPELVKYVSLNTEGKSLTVSLNCPASELSAACRARREHWQKRRAQGQPCAQ